MSVYPNPLRLFSTSRDTWFANYINNFDIPLHIFTAIRDTQLGQIMYAIEDRRLKQIRAGEDPGVSMLDGESLSMFVPLFQSIQFLQDFLAKEEIDLEMKNLKKILTASEAMKAYQKTKKVASEWFVSQDFDRLDELYLASARVFYDVLLPLIEENMKEIPSVQGDDEKNGETEVDEPIDESQMTIFDKIKRIEPMFGDTLFNLLDPIIYESVRDKTWTITEEDDKTRLISIEGSEEPRKLPYNEFHGKTNILISMVLEIERLVKLGEKYSRDFNQIPHLLTLEMLIMIPQPDKNRIPVIKHHLNELKKGNLEVQEELFDLLSFSYQAFTLVFDMNHRLFQKRLKNMEKNFKQYARVLWRKLSPQLLSSTKTERNKAELLVATLWTHFRVIQAQTQQYAQTQEHDDHQHNYAYRFMLRFEQMFWNQAKDYVNVEKFLSPVHFWAAYAKIANKEIRSPKESLNLYKEFKELIGTTKILSNKTQRKKFDVTVRDHKSIIQTLLSYGFESKETEIYPDLAAYVDKLSKVIDEVEVDVENYPEISIEEERRTIKSISEMLKAPIPV